MFQPRSGWGAPTCIAVVGAAGASGASTTAVALAAACNRTEATWLLDLVPASGMELLIGAETQPGLRWRELDRTRGEINAQQLAAECPAYGDMPTVLGGREETGPPNDTAACSIIASLCAQGNVVVADVDKSALLRLHDLWTHVVVVSPLTLQGLANTHQLVRYLASTSIEIKVVASMLVSPDLTITQFEKSLGIPISGYLPILRSIRPAIIHGLGPLGAGPRTTRKLLDFAHHLADRISTHEPA
ncbi:hypothetical protein ACFSYH_14570 [Populibacterium corticicola]|uniref:Uncharacterized protein n=1 Tax=Populibacterium corticicola TaxID=1812826 RepID=A0ABW5XJN1_9MICO